jgi:hypothetical protein
MAEVKTILKYTVNDGPTYGGGNDGSQQARRVSSTPYATPGVPASAPVNYDKHD